MLQLYTMRTTCPLLCPASLPMGIKLVCLMQPRHPILTVMLEGRYCSTYTHYVSQLFLTNSWFEELKIYKTERW